MPRKTRRQKKAADRQKRNFKPQAQLSEKTKAAKTQPQSQEQKKAVYELEEIGGKPEQIQGAKKVAGQKHSIKKDLAKTFIIAGILITLELIIFFANLV